MGTSPGSISYLKRSGSHLDYYIIGLFLFSIKFNPPSRSASADEKRGLIPRSSTPKIWVQGSTLRLHTFDFALMPIDKHFVASTFF